jgi:2-polyprenyl-3-methyl-5-hydroxy-6-metoxy-1,4-benzoquinol methylase
VKNIDFRVSDVLEDRPEGRFDLISCMGVTSVIIDENMYRRLLQRLVEVLAPSGYLLMKDTLSTAPSAEYLHTGQRPTIYRSQKAYLKYLASLGLELKHSVPLQNRPKKNRRNSLFLFQKVG